MQATRNCDVYFRLHWQNVPAPTISPHTRLGRPFCHYHRNVRRDVITDYSELSDSPLRALVPHPSVITVFLSNSLTKHFDYCFPVWHSNKKQKTKKLHFSVWHSEKKKKNRPVRASLCYTDKNTFLMRDSLFDFDKNTYISASVPSTPPKTRLMSVSLSDTLTERF